jgi:hypothetical protein
MHVRQMSISYQPEQDRILVRVNTSENRELQFWFTRRLTLGLAPLMERLVNENAAKRGDPATTHLVSADPVTQKAMADFKRSETIRSADFSTPYQVTETNAPLFDSPLLITDVNLAPIAAGALRLQCSEKLSGAPQTRKFELALSDTLTHAFMHLLERAVVASQWRGNRPTEPAAAATAPAVPPTPGYLN